MLKSPITLRLSNVPLGEALRYTANLAQLKYRVDRHAVLVLPIGEPENDLFTNQYTVPPTFLSSHIGGGSDPFARNATQPDQSGRITARELLERAGITFGPGTTAIYNPQTSTLIVKNNASQMELVEAYIESIRTGVEKQIYVTARVYTSPEPFEGPGMSSDETHAEASGLSMKFDNWNEMSAYLNSDEVAKQMEARRTLTEYRKAHGSEAFKIKSVITDPQFQIFHRETIQKAGVETFRLSSLLIRSGKSALFSIDQVALGTSVVLGPDNKTIGIRLLVRNFAEPVLEPASASRVTVEDGHTVLIGGKVGKEKYLLMVVKAVIQDPAGQRINTETKEAEPSATSEKSPE